VVAAGVEEGENELQADDDLKIRKG